MHAKIAVASDDGVSVSEHFGRAHQFVVFEIRNGEILAQESRAGSCPDQPTCHCYNQDQVDAVPLGRSHVITILADCHAVLCRGMGWRVAEELVRRGVNPLVITGDLSPRTAVEHYLAGTLKPAPGFCRR